MTLPPASGSQPDPGSTPTSVPAPEPTGDVVSGDPPVPITVWRLPRPPAGISVSAALAHRLTVNYTARGSRVVDLTTDPQVAGVRSGPRRRRSAALVITAWPEQSSKRRDEHRSERSAGDHERPRHERSPEQAAERPGERSPGGRSRVGEQPHAQVTEHRPAGEQRERPSEHLSEHLASCSALLRERGCLAVVVTTADIPDQLGQVVDAARRCGLTYLQHIVVAHQLAAPTSTTRSSPRRRIASGRHLRAHTDVLILMRRAGHE